MQTRKLTEVPKSEFSKESNFVVEIDEELKRVPGSEIRQIVSDEEARAQAAEGVLAEGLQGEISRARGAEQALMDELSVETIRAMTKEAEIKSALDDESARADEVERLLIGDLSSEVSRAMAVEGILADSLSTETTRATGVEATLTENLSAEIERATETERKLTADLSAEVTRAKAAEKVLTDNLSAESARAAEKEEELQGDIQTEVARAQDVEKTLSDSLSTETARATAAEKTLTDSLASEVTRAQGTEKVLTDNLATEVTRAKAAEKINTDNITAEANRAKAKETEIQSSVQTEVGRATAAEESIRNTINSNKPNWDDKYTRNEVDNKFSALETAIDWKEAVNSFTDLASVYPKPDDGWTVNVKDTDYTYRWSGTEWVAISANAIPKATQDMDGLLSKEDKINYDDAYTKRHTHSNKSIIDKLTQSLLDNWNDANSKKHGHGNKSIIDGITQTLIDTWNTVGDKVDKVTGKGLSTNDYTDSEKSIVADTNAKKHTHSNKAVIDKVTQAMLDKLAGIASGAEVNVQSDWSVSDTASDAFIKNKPSSMPASDVAAWAKAASKPSYGWAEITGKPSSFTPIEHSHTINQITDMPTKVSQFTNDAGYITQDDVDTTQNHVHTNKTVLDKITQALLDNWSAAFTHISDTVKHITVTERSNWNDANSKKHTHSNKGILDGITQALIDKWNSALTALPTHTHTKSQITDFPTSLKNPAALTISLNGTSQGVYDGSAAKALNITASSIGAAAGGHNHDSAYVKKTSRILTLTAADWSSSYPYTQIVTVSGVAASDDIKVLGIYVPSDATADQVKTWNKAAGCLMCNPDGVADGKITFKAYKKPSVDFQIITEGG